MAVFAAVISYIMQMTSFVLLRRKLPNIERPYRSQWGVPGAVIAGILAAISLVAIFLNDAYRPGVYGVAIYYVLGVLYFAIAGRHRLVLSPEEEFALTQGEHGVPGQEGYATLAARSRRRSSAAVGERPPRPHRSVTGSETGARQSSAVGATAPPPSRLSAGGERTMQRRACSTSKKLEELARRRRDRHGPVHVHRPPGPVHGQARAPALLPRGGPRRGGPPRLSVPAGDRHGDGAAARLRVRELGDRLRRLPDGAGHVDAPARARGSRRPRW